MENYYFLGGKHTPIGTVAFAPKEGKLGHELIQELDGKSVVPFEFKLKKVTEGKNDLIYNDSLEGLTMLWEDYQANSLAWPMMSERLKATIESNAKKSEAIDWIACTLKAGNESKIYYILRFNKVFDVLDLQKTLFIPGTDDIIRPCFSLSKIREYNIFTKPFDYNLWKITSAIYVNEAIRKAVQKAKLTGVKFEKVLVAE